MNETIAFRLLVPAQFATMIYLQPIELDADVQQKNSWNGTAFFWRKPVDDTLTEKASFQNFSIRPFDHFSRQKAKNRIANTL